MRNAVELFSFRHSQRNITVWLRGRGSYKRYIGAVNGEVCAESPAKGDLLRRLIEVARTYPKAEMPLTHPRRQRRGGRRTRRVVPMRIAR